MKKMVKKLILPVAMLVGLGSNTFATDPVWQVVGETEFSQYGAHDLDIGIDSKDTPYVVYDAYGSTVGVVARKYNGSEWVVVGDLGFTEAKSPKYLSMDFDSKDTPHVAFMEFSTIVGDSHSGATAMKYDSSHNTWVLLEEREFTGSGGYYSPSTWYTSLAIDNHDVPYLVFSVARRDGEWYRAQAVKYYSSDDTWYGAGYNFTENGTKETNLAINNENIPYVVYWEDANGDKASVMKYDRIYDGMGGSWLEWTNVGSARFSAGAVKYTSIALNSANIPYVAYKDYANGGKATVMQYHENNNTWEPVGQAGFTPGTAEFVSLAIDGSDTLYVAYNTSTNSGGINVMKYDGSNWVNVGNANFIHGTMNGTAALAINSKGVPYVAFKNLGTAVKATVMYAPSITCKRKDQDGNCIPGVEDPGWTGPYPEVPFDGNYGQGDTTIEGERVLEPEVPQPYPPVPCGGAHEQGSDECTP